jgi:hypothetical protein
MYGSEFLSGIGGAVWALAATASGSKASTITASRLTGCQRTFM